MVNAKDLRNEYIMKLKALQDVCPHAHTTLMEHQWAPGHVGAMVNVCDVCEKIIKSQA